MSKEAVGEACDDGNEIDEDACTQRCLKARCGDGFVWEGVELCDDGDEADENACTAKPEPARCGDGILRTDREPDEEGRRGLR